MGCAGASRQCSPTSKPGALASPEAGSKSRIDWSGSYRFRQSLCTGPFQPGQKKNTLSRNAAKKGGQTLTDTARLRQSITHRADAAGVEVGSNVVYAAIHQFGGTIRKKAPKQTLEFDDDTGRLISRKAAARRKTGLIRVVNAQIGAHSVTMPARPFLGISDQGRTSILDIVTRRLAEGLR